MKTWTLVVGMMVTLAAGCGGGGLIGSPHAKHAEAFPKLDSTYDEITGFTRTVAYIRVAPYMVLEFAAMQRGQSGGPPGAVQLSIQTITQNWEHLDRPMVVLLVDGERFWFTDAKHGGLAGGHRVREDVTVPLTPELLAKLSMAESIRGTLDGDKFEVPTADIPTIDRFAARITSGSATAEESEASRPRLHPVHHQSVVLQGPSSADDEQADAEDPRK